MKYWSPETGLNDVLSGHMFDKVDYNMNGLLDDEERKGLFDGFDVNSKFRIFS